MGLVLVVALVSGACATTNGAAPKSASLMEPVTTDPNPNPLGHPIRGIAFALHPVGVFLDNFFVRPVHYLVSRVPGLFGWTPEDEAAFRAKESGEQPATSLP